ncbi:hypothetical protein J8F10_32150 [Gemmata sp. G18]|uniref:RNase H type-1 domain-containing protein n=1 Tax=Gemmata palustris TaxID=2822762 RepID=A0ABS5C1S3_9BACT|nr:hypothetical protein [Gemmata palustris]
MPPQLGDESERSDTSTGRRFRVTRTEIFTDGSYNDHTDSGGWEAVVFRHTSGQQTGTTNQEMEPRAIVESVKMAEGPTTVVSDHEGIVGIIQRGMTPRWSPDVWGGLYAATEGKDVDFVWQRRDQSFGQRLAHQFARRGEGPGTLNPFLLAQTGTARRLPVRCTGPRLRRRQPPATRRAHCPTRRPRR